MSETLLSSSRIALFGRVVEDLQIVQAPTDDVASPSLLEQKLRAEDACFARIYGFSHEGLFHALPRPALLLVQGKGEAVGAEQQGGLDAARGSALLLPEGLHVWICDKGDHSILLQLHSGTLEQLLLQGEGPDAGMSLRGMSVEGMSLRGMSLQGMSLRGMSAQGMSARGMSAPGPRGDDTKD